METGYILCIEDYLGEKPNMLISITNKNQTSWADLWYVVCLGITLTNDDGWINKALTFKVDKVGVNTSLVYKSKPVPELSTSFLLFSAICGMFFKYKIKLFKNLCSILSAE